MPATLPGDVEEEQGTAAELARQDQTDAAFRDITEHYDETAKEPKLKVQGSLPKKSIRNRVLIGTGVGGGIVGLAIILFFLLLFKNIHIKNLFLDYEFAKFNRAFRNRLEASVKEADPTAASGGDTIQPDTPPDVALTEINPDQLKQLQTDIQSDPGAFNDAASQVSSLDQAASVPGTTASEVDPEFGVSTAVASTDSEPDAKAKDTTDRAIKQQIDQADTGQTAPDPAVQEAVDNTSKDISAGGTPTTAAQAAGEGFASGLSSFISQAQGVAIFATIGCIIRDIYVSGYKAVAQLKLTGLANSAATTNKYADCQKQGKCSLAQVGAVAEQFDGPVDGQAQSFTSSCGAVRASGKVAQPGLNCTDLDTNMRPVPQLAGGFSGNLGVMLHTADTVNSLLNIPGLGSGCALLLKPVTQLVIAGLSVGGQLTAAILSDGASLTASSVGQAAAIGAGQVFATKAGQALALDAALHYGGLLFKQNFSPIQKGNMQAAGDKALASDACARNGCRQLTQSENTQLALEIHADMVSQSRNRGLAYRLFSPQNPTSTLGMLVDRIPSRPQTAMAVIGQFIATTLNPQRLGKSFIALINPIKPAWAADTEYNTYGIPDYGFTDTELSQWGVKANSQWVKANIIPDQNLRSKFDKCFDPTQTKLASLITGDGNGATCNSYNDKGNADYTAFQHYRIYKLDQRVTQDLVLLYNKQSGVGGANSAEPVPSGGDCVNPFTDPGWGLSRTDQGVDYTSASPLPVYAICDGTILSTFTPGWPLGDGNGNIISESGPFIYYKFDSTPNIPAQFQGKCVYVAENLTNVHALGHVSAGEQIATTIPGSPNIEMGWAAGPGTPATPAVSKDHNNTPGGLAFARFVKNFLHGPVRDDPGTGPMYVGASCP